MDIAAWLRELDLERYETAFRNNDIHVDLLSELTDADLERLGVASLGHRKKLLRAIEAVRPPGPEVAAVSITKMKHPLGLRRRLHDPRPSGGG